VDRESELLSARYHLMACVVTRPSLELSPNFTLKSLLSMQHRTRKDLKMKIPLLYRGGFPLMIDRGPVMSLKRKFYFITLAI
jgi:hypothetical protein